MWNVELTQNISTIDTVWNLELTQVIIAAVGGLGFVAGQEEVIGSDWVKSRLPILVNETNYGVVIDFTHEMYVSQVALCIW